MVSTNFLSLTRNIFSSPASTESQITAILASKCDLVFGHLRTSDRAEESWEHEKQGIKSCRDEKVGAIGDLGLQLRAARVWGSVFEIARFCLD
ncbi:hypothetical protein HYQ46_000119 [Verticillium longisporum]|nr:hypothetical protein HYQ46_000119 [Verticillium longisporum]